MANFTQDLVTGFDPTSSAQITQAQLLAMVQGATPFNGSYGIGFAVVTTDIAGVPQVPDARNGTGDEKIQRYSWIRVQATTASLYIWSPGSPLDATFLYWIPVAISIPAGSIIGADIALNTIASGNIISVDWTQITGIPTGGFTPSGAAGGALNGNYPNPGIAANAVTTPTINGEAVTGAKLSGSAGGAPCVDITKNIIVQGVWTALQSVRVNAGATGLEAVTKLILQLAEPLVGNANNRIRVNNAGLAFEYITPATDFNQSKLLAQHTTAEQALAANTFSSEAHGLASLPTSVRWVLRCKNGELGYSTGDEIDASAVLNNGATLPNYNFGADATNVWIVQADGTPTIRKRTPTIGAGAQVTPANWKLVGYCNV